MAKDDRTGRAKGRPRRDTASTSEEKVDYSPHPDDAFNVWVELGTLDPEDRRVLAHSPIRRYTIMFKSSSPEAEAFIHEPLPVLRERDIPGVRDDSKVTTTIHHHERGMRKRIIRATVSVEQSSGDVAIELDKETW